MSSKQHNYNINSMRVAPMLFWSYAVCIGQLTYSSMVKFVDSPIKGAPSIEFSVEPDTVVSLGAVYI